MDSETYNAILKTVLKFTATAIVFFVGPLVLSWIFGRRSPISHEGLDAEIASQRAIDVYRAWDKRSTILTALLVPVIAYFVYLTMISIRDLPFEGAGDPSQVVLKPDAIGLGIFSILASFAAAPLLLYPSMKSYFSQHQYFQVTISGYWRYWGKKLGIDWEPSLLIGASVLLSTLILSLAVLYSRWSLSYDSRGFRHQAYLGWTANYYTFSELKAIRFHQIVDPPLGRSFHKPHYQIEFKNGVVLSSINFPDPHRTRAREFVEGLVKISGLPLQAVE